MRELGRRGAEARWRKEAERKAQGDSAPTGAEIGASRDAERAKKALLKVLDGGNEAATVSAAREILAHAGALTVEKPRTLAALEAMTREQRHALLRALERAHYLPNPEMTSVDAG